MAEIDGDGEIVARRCVDRHMWRRLSEKVFCVRVELP